MHENIIRGAFRYSNEISFKCEETREMPMSSSLDLFKEIFKNELSEEKYEKLSDDCYSCDSRVGGYPYFVHNDYFGFDHEDFLLLQLDIDDELALCLEILETAFFYSKRCFEK